MNAGWEVKPFEECIEPVTYTTKIKRKNFLDSGQFPIVSQEEAPINGYWDNPSDVFPVSTPVVVFGDHTKCFKFVDFSFVLGADGVKILKPIQTLDPRFFYYQLHSLELEALGYARHYRLLKRSSISIPPLGDQHRIVAVLDKAFASIAAATANAEKNLTNTRALFESFLASIVGEQDEKWQTGRLSDIGGSVSTGPFGSLLHKSDYIENGVPLINPAHIVGDRIQPDYNKSINPKTLARLSAYQVSEGDIVIGRRGEIGRCAVVTDNETGWLCGTGCFFIRPKKTVNPHFLAHLLRSRPYRNLLETVATGATMLNLSNTALSELNIALPQSSQQNEYLIKLNDVSRFVGEIESKLQTKLSALTELKQSLLQKAFAGELT